MGILDRAELLLRAERYTGSGDWLDESGNGHDAQLGSGSGADTNDPLFKPYDGTVYTYLPGTSGNYASTADVNLLDADTAHGAQSNGKWVENAGLTGNPAVTADTTSPFGDTSLVGTCNSSADDTAGVKIGTGWDSSGVQGLSGATQYTLSVWVKMSHACDIELITLWGQAGVGADGSASEKASVSANTWTQLSETFTTGASTDMLRATLYWDNGTSLSGETMAIAAACLRAGTSSSFVPSLRIVGDVDARMKAAATDWTPSTPWSLFGRHVSGGTAAEQPWVYYQSANPVIYWSDGTLRTCNMTNPTVTNGEPAVLKVTIDVDNGASGSDVKLYQSTDEGSLWSQVGSTNTVAGTTGVLVPGAGVDLFVGANEPNNNPFQGDIHWAEIRDGIDGPIVAKYRASDASEPFATHTGAQDGRTWTHNRSSSGLVSTVVDRDMFLLTTDDYFEIADDDALDIGVGENLTWVFVGTTTTSTPTGRLVSKRSGNPHWDSNLGSNILQRSVSDGTNSDFGTTASATITRNKLHRFAMVLKHGDETVGYIDDSSSTRSMASVTGTLANSSPLYIGRWGSGGYFEGTVVAVALFREALTDNEIYLAGRALVKQVDDPQDLHGDALKTWIVENDSNWTSSMSTELVGLLNDLNGTSGKEYAEARATYLSVDPAG